MKRALALLLAIALPSEAEPPPANEPGDLRDRRLAMVREQIEARGVRHAEVLEALRQVPRHRFVPAELQDRAYADGPLPIGGGQTISQPFIVASMTALLDPQPDDVVLEIGTGSGYQAAVLASLVRHVFTVEIRAELAAEARDRLDALGIVNIDVIVGDGWKGLPARGPFDGILVTAAPPEVPTALTEQLRTGARLVIPVGSESQELRVIERTKDGLEEHPQYPVRFVPMIRGSDD